MLRVVSSISTLGTITGPVCNALRASLISVKSRLERGSFCRTFFADFDEATIGGERSERKSREKFLTVC